MLVPDFKSGVVVLSPAVRLMFVLCRSSRHGRLQKTAKWKKVRMECQKVRKERKKVLSGRETHVSCILGELSDSPFELSLNRSN
jgi:hypothetical protein